MKFVANNKTYINLNICYDNKTIEGVSTKFFGLQIDNNLKWKKHIEYIIPRRSLACFAMGTVTPLLKVDTLKLVYFPYFHSIISYGIIFWENSTDSKIIFNTQNKISR
jgi:hypothetical protein